MQQRHNQEALQTALAREKEVDILYEKLFEEKDPGNLTEDRFKKLSYKYEDEQSELKQRIKHLKAVVAEKAHEMNAARFLQLVRRYTDITELTPEIYYQRIGYVELPEMSGFEKEAYVKSFGYIEKDQGA